MRVAEGIEKEFDFDKEIKVKKEKEKIKIIREIQERLSNIV